MDTSQSNVNICLNAKTVNTDHNSSKDVSSNDILNEESLKSNAESTKQDDSIANSIREANNINEPDISFDASNDSVISSDKSTQGSVIVKNVDNTSLCNLLLYSSDDETQTETSEFESNEEDDSQQEGAGTKNTKTPSNINTEATVKKMNELGLDELPPVPDLSTLKIDVTAQDCTQMGAVSSIVDRLVIIESLPNIPAYDIDTLLFLDNGKTPLGYVHDVLGPVSNPMYAIRFNSRQEIDSLNISKGLPVYCAPKTEHTQYVFLKQLLEAKGSDASWTDDIEVPAEFADYSDDEAEHASRRKNHDPNSNRKRNSFDKHRNFEKNMNVRNILDTRLHKIRDSCEPSNKKHMPNTKTSQNSKQGQPCIQSVYRFAPNSTINNVPSMPQVHGYYRLPPYVGPNIFPPPNYRNMAFTPFSSPPPLPPPNIPQFRSNVPLPPAVFLNPPPPGVDINTRDQPLLMHTASNMSSNSSPNLPFYNPPPPPPSHMNWYNLPNNLPQSSSGAFGGLPYFQKP